VVADIVNGAYAVTGMVGLTRVRDMGMMGNLLIGTQETTLMWFDTTSPPMTPGQLNLDGGETAGLTILGDRAVTILRRGTLDSSGQLVFWDFSNPAQPALENSLVLRSGFPMDVTADDRFVYVATDSGLKIFDER
jgi:hypothetical protein